METVFQAVLHMSLSAAILVLALLLLRPLLKKAPKWLCCGLWILVAVRLICPVIPESPLSIMPDTQPISQQIISLEPAAPTATVITGTGVPIRVSPNDPDPGFQFHFWMVWVAGMIAMLLYMCISVLAVHRKVRIWEQLEKGVRRCDYIGTPFILGVFFPKIYLPSSLPEESRNYVIAHEQAHLRRKDHWWKPLGFLLLSIHWFNPMIWLGYILLCRDIEFACDEKVIRDMEPEQKKAYSEALLTGSVRQKYITACPLAFGEVGVKARIKSVLNYKKPAFWIILIAVLLSVGLTVGFLTNRPEKEPDKESVPTLTSMDGVFLEIVDGTLYMQCSEDEGNSSTKSFTLDHTCEVPSLSKGDSIRVFFWEGSAAVMKISKQQADWGVIIKLSDVTAESLQLQICQNSQVARPLLLNTGYTISVAENYQFIPIVDYPNNGPISLENGIPYNETITYQNLGPGQYRLNCIVTCEQESRTFAGDFTIAETLAGTLDEAVSQTVHHILARKLLVPSALPQDDTLENMTRPENGEPMTYTIIGGAKDFEQIISSYVVLDYKVEDIPPIGEIDNNRQHTLSILGLCRGYKNKMMAEEVYSPMLLVIEEAVAGGYKATSCKMPSQQYYQADVEFLFPPTVAGQILQSQLQLESLRKTCDEKVSGGIYGVIGARRDFKEAETNAKLILQAIDAGKKYDQEYDCISNYTIVIGNAVYYYQAEGGIINITADKTSVVLTEEGRNTVNTILEGSASS